MDRWESKRLRPQPCRRSDAGGISSLFLRSGHAAAGPQQFCDFGQGADRRLASRQLAIGGRRQGRACWGVAQLRRHRDADHNRCIGETIEPDRNRSRRARTRNRRSGAIGLGSAVDPARSGGRGPRARCSKTGINKTGINKPIAETGAKASAKTSGQIVTGCKLDGTDCQRKLPWKSVTWPLSPPHGGQRLNESGTGGFAENAIT